MAKCTGVRCPMQYGYKVEECNHTDCTYRTEPITNADRIRAMSDEELANIMAGTPICKERYMDCIKDGLDCEACLLEWLKQSTKGE